MKLRKYIERKAYFSGWRIPNMYSHLRPLLHKDTMLYATLSLHLPEVNQKHGVCFMYITKKEWKKNKSAKGKRILKKTHFQNARDTLFDVFNEALPKGHRLKEKV